MAAQRSSPEQHGDRYTRLASNTVVFAISNFSSKLLTFLVKPFLSHVMKETSVMGVVNLAQQCANLLIPFVSLGVSGSIIRFGLDKGCSKKQLFTNGLLTIFLGYAIMLLCTPLLRLMPTMAQYNVLIYIYVLTSCLRSLCTQFVRSRQMNRLIAIDGVLCTFSTVMLYVLFLVVFKLGANGYLMAIILGDLLSAMFLFAVAGLGKYIDFTHINRRLWGEMLRFSLPMIPAQISFWIINASDVFYLKYMCDGYGGLTGDDWSGLISAGYWMPTILNTLGLIFYEAWQLSAMTEEKERERFFSKVFRMYSGVLFCCAAGIIWLCQPMMHIFRSNFQQAWMFVPFLTIAAIFTCFNQFFNSIYVIYKRSTNALYTMVAGAAVNCFFNYFFIIWWGPVGATPSSLLGLFTVFLLRAVNTRGMLRVDFRPARMAVNIGMLLCEAFLLLLGAPHAFLWCGLLTALVIAYNFGSVWAMARVLLPKVFGRRGRALTAKVDGLLGARRPRT